MTLDVLARDTGTFVMVAMDQRESLRTMLGEHHAPPIPDERLVAFKLAVAEELAPYASGFLIDGRYGFDRVRLPPGCALLLAADALVQEPGGLVEDTELDDELDVAGAAAAGVAALKLLVIWRRDGEGERRVELSRRFVELCRAHGLLSVLEGVVRTAPDERDDAIVEAARELALIGPSLYKVEVPTELDRCADIDAAVGCPWVVLSSGVEPDAFPAAVEAACRAGASGLLAGRAVWRAALPADDPRPLLREHSVPMLRRLGDIVDRHGRPWRDKA